MERSQNRTGNQILIRIWLEETEWSFVHLIGVRNFDSGKFYLTIH